MLLSTLMRLTWLHSATSYTATTLLGPQNPDRPWREANANHQPHNVSWWFRAGDKFCNVILLLQSSSYHTRGMCFPNHAAQQSHRIRAPLLGMLYVCLRKQMKQNIGNCVYHAHQPVKNWNIKAVLPNTFLLLNCHLFTKTLIFQFSPNRPGSPQTLSSRLNK